MTAWALAASVMLAGACGFDGVGGGAWSRRRSVGLQSDVVEHEHVLVIDRRLVRGANADHAVQALLDLQIAPHVRRRGAWRRPSTKPNAEPSCDSVELERMTGVPVLGTGFGVSLEEQATARAAAKSAAEMDRVFIGTQTMRCDAAFAAPGPHLRDAAAGSCAARGV